MLTLDLNISSFEWMFLSFFLLFVDRLYLSWRLDCSRRQNEFEFQGLWFFKKALKQRLNDFTRHTQIFQNTKVVTIATAGSACTSSPVEHMHYDPGKWARILLGSGFWILFFIFIFHSFIIRVSFGWCLDEVHLYLWCEKVS